MYEKILVPIDGSEPAKAALYEIIKIVAGRAPPLVRLLHVVDIPYRHELFPEGTVGDTVQKSQSDAGQSLLSDAKDFLWRSGVRSDTVLVESPAGRVADRILASAAEWPAELIVMGTHGRKGFSRLVLGSNAAEVVRQALVPVLLVRAAT